MKRILYRESISTRKEGQCGWWYTSIDQNAKYIFDILENYSVSCEKIEQFSDSYWRLEIKGKKKNVRAFITSIALAVAGVYNVREYS